MPPEAEDALEIEAEGVRLGLNPMFGTWSHHFRFAPTPYRNGRELTAFRQAVRQELNNAYLYTHDVRLQATLYLDLQDVWETSDVADLDNYAKALLDCLKGPDGLMVDDSQLSSLQVNWTDAAETSFEVELSGSPDDFILKPVELYEMPDKLWYPHSRRVWDMGTALDLPEKDFLFGLTVTEMYAGAQKRARAIWRNAGMNRLEAYRVGRAMAGSSRGFHRTRILEAGFPMHTLTDWRRYRDEWRRENPGVFEPVGEMIAELRAAWDEAADALVAIRV